MSCCLVVGAGQGIGAAVARRFAAEGFSVGLVARDEQRLQRTADAIGPGIRTASGDIARPESLAAALAGLQQDLGAADVLVYNAAMARPGAAGELSVDELSDALAVDVVGAVAATQAVLPAMRDSARGTLLFTGGGLALHPSGQFAALSVGKAAIRAWALALHEDLLHQGVHAATVTVTGVVEPGTRFDPDLIAEWYWQLHVQPGAAWEGERVFG